MEICKKTTCLTMICLILLVTGQGADAFFKEVIGGIIGVGAATVALPAALGAVGFTAAGITAGSCAASMMSASAIASGGGVAAGSTVAVLQSVGAAGLSSGGLAAAGIAGAAVAREYEYDD
ncbi:interferon alpha-inducible protein 27-like protein 2A [Lytechinus variegatus]|uniref:interferon alpha-inducible protein 27-like protein 2A n=1 Tax=Lytechinus variegatus TaxID=7654 RepID=UPI001BB1755D|nr:interferon alpha-inducible protein 27-like protein 2A [Lytechinus variegatus]